MRTRVITTPTDDTLTRLRGHRATKAESTSEIAHCANRDSSGSPKGRIRYLFARIGRVAPVVRAGRFPMLALALALPAGTAQADDAERVFRDALLYTVQIRTAVAAPLEGDLKGTRRGAGFVVDAERGWIMTNAHVASRSAARVEVSRREGAYVEATPVYVDPHLDVAILQVPLSAEAPLAAAPLGCDDSPGVGHAVGAFGHPWNMRYTGTRGIVSGVTTQQSQEMLQTDAPINAGNSGGPLISLESGLVIGINTAQIRGSQNTNFAVPMPYACRILRLLQRGVDPSPPDLGVVYFDDLVQEGLLKVARNYAPDRVPLRPGDVIEAVEDVRDRISNETQLIDALRGKLSDFSLRVRRGGQRLVVRTAAPPESLVTQVRGLLTGGVLFAPTPLRDAAEVNVGALMIHHVERGSDGDAKELRRGDFLEAIDGQPIASLSELQRYLSSHVGEVTLTLKRYSGGARVFSYLERSLRVEGLEEVGAAPGRPAVALREGQAPDASPHRLEPTDARG